PDVPLDRLPQSPVIGLEDRPTGALDDGLLDHVHEATNVDVAPFAAARRQCPCPPNANATAGEVTDTVDSGGIEYALLGAGHLIRQTQHTSQRLIGRRLVDTASTVGS